MSALGGIAVAVIAVGAEAYLRTANAVYGIAIPPDPSESVLNFWALVDLLFFAAVALGGVIFAIRRAMQIGTADEQMLVLMPDGFVKRTGTAQKDSVAVAYGAIANMTPTVDRGSHYLVMRTSGGKRSRIEIDNRFGNAKNLSRQIAGQHAHYLSMVASGGR